MPRLSRIVMPGFPHHVTQRGNNRRDVFFSEEDRQVYLSLLREYSAEYGVDVIGFCLMTNHIHLIAVPRFENSLAKALGRTHNDYARWLQIRRRESGHLWQNRYFSCPLEAAYTWAALAYVERNPVRAGLVTRAEHWRWSSAVSHLQERRGEDWIAFEEWSRNWTPFLWRVAIEDGLAEATLRSRMHEATRTGRPLGDADFLRECEQRSGRQLEKKEPGPKRKQAGLENGVLAARDAA